MRLTLTVSFEDLRASVESLYQGSKVFSNGGPYKDLYNEPSIIAKKGY